jgi:HK97 family phage major capsid protein
MKNSLELKETRSGLVDTLEAIKNTAEGESRNLNEAESIEVDNALKSIEDLDVKIERAEKVEKELRNAAASVGTPVSNNVEKEVRDYSFQDAISQAKTGVLSGLVKEMDQEARNEAKYTGQNYRGVGIPVSVLTRSVVTAPSSPLAVQAFTDQLDANLVLTSAGANLYTGIADAKFPIISGITSSFVAEDPGADVAASGTTTSMSLTPNKLISVVDMSVEAMTQNPGLENAIRRNMAQSIAATWESNLLAAANAAAGPASIFAAAAGTSTPAAGAVAASDFIAMEQAVFAANIPLEGSRMAYIMNAPAYGDCRTLLQTTGVNPLWNADDKRLNNYYGFVSSNVGNDATTKARALFGDFTRMHLAQFGGIDILFDGYTLARQGQGSLIVTTLVDGNATQVASAFSSLVEA